MTEIYEVIEQLEKVDFSTSQLCEILSVSRSAYYGWYQGEAGMRQQQDAVLKPMVRTIFKEHKRRYGARRIAVELRERGFCCSRLRTRRLLDPLERRAGHVFAPARKDGHPMARNVLKASKTISAIGNEANVLVDPVTGKSASAHDLRRAFGYRWSRRVMPPQLKELMRHASIETTMTYYVGQNAEATAAELWEALGHKLGHIEDSTRPQPLKN